MRIRTLMAGLLLVTTLTACGGDASAPANATPEPTSAAAATQAPTDANAAAELVLQVSVTYRERILLLPGTAVTVELQDVTDADVPATIVTSASMVSTNEQVPLAFELTYAPEDIQPDHTYVVMARMINEGRLMFVTTQAYPVLTNGAPVDAIEVVLTKM